MAEDKCPTSGYQCIDQLTARTQAVVDQIQGFLAFVEQSKEPVTTEQILDHYSTIKELLQENVDDYVQDHGRPHFLADVEATLWVVKRVVG